MLRVASSGSFAQAANAVALGFHSPLRVVHVQLWFCITRSSLSTTTPIDQVDSLMMEIGSEANINVADMFARAGQPLSAAAVSATAAPAAAARSTYQ